MTFGPAALIPIAGLSLPEPDPNSTAPPEDRVFSSPPRGEGLASLLAWVQGPGSAAVELWLRVGSTAWLRLASQDLNEALASVEAPVPADARLFLRVVSSLFAEHVAVGFVPSSGSSAAGLIASGLFATGPPVTGDPGLGVYVIGSVSVGVEGLTNVTAALGPTDPGLPVRLEIEDRIPALQLGRTPVILGVGGEGGDQPLGTELAPLAVRGSDGTSFQQLALEHVRADDPHAVRVSDGADFLVPAKAEQLPAVLVGGRLDENLGAWLGSTAPTVGQKAAASSIPAVLASDVGLPAGANALGSVNADLRVAASAVTNGNPVPVSDAAGSLTVDAPVGTPVFVRLSNGAAPTGVQASPLISDPSTPGRTATGTPAPATSGVILAGAGLVWQLAAHFTGAGNKVYLQVHEAGTLATATMIPGLSFRLDVLNPELTYDWLRPLSITGGCKWAMSDTQDTYTASAETAVVFFQAQ